MTKINPEAEAIAHNIKAMRIRGAGRIARAAAKALLLTARNSQAKDIQRIVHELEETGKILIESRPTAVSLPNAVRFILKRVSEAKVHASSISEIRKLACDSALRFISDSNQAVQKIGEIGARRIENGDVILTHCNSEAALSVLGTAWKKGKSIRVFATESRPRLQGRITIRRLDRIGIPTTLIIDSAVRYFMNKIDKVIVGADTITANGAIVNKIGTSTIALAAKEARTLFYVATETYKFSPATVFGELVKVEERDSSEIIPKSLLCRLSNITVRNPSFDITPPEFVDLILTEKGVIPPQASISVIQQEFGWALFEETTHSIAADEEN